MTEKLFQLKVPFYSQRDNDYAAEYTCNSASCCMLAMFSDPSLTNKLGTDNPDQKYFETLIAPYGTSMDHSNQTAALDYLGVKSEWHTSISLEQVAVYVETHSKPAALAILHHGDVSNGEQATGGHIIVLIGTVRDEAGKLLRLICNDPNGELHNDTGGYSGASEDGAGVQYSYANLVKRFETDDNGNYTPGPCGWARLLV